MAIMDIVEQRKVDKVNAETKVNEEMEKKELAVKEESMAQQQLDEANENLERSRVQALKAKDEAVKANSSDARIKAEEANKELDEAQEKYQSAANVFQVASQKVIAANEALEQAIKDVTMIQQILSAAPQSQPLVPEDASNVDEDDFNRKYSKFLSYSKDKYPNYPIRVWTLTEEHLSFIQIYYIIPKNLTTKEAKDQIDNFRGQC